MADIHEEQLRTAIKNAAQILTAGRAPSDMTERLCEAFGSAALALEAPEKEISRCCPGVDKLAFSFSMAMQVARYMLNELAVKENTVQNLMQAKMRLQPLYLGAHYECTYMICLTKEARFISCVPLREGTMDGAPFYIRIIIEEALLSGGECFVIAHNHPAGTPVASADDCASTLNVLDAMSQLQLTLIDHIIMAGDEIVSIRKTGSIAANIWNKLSPYPEAFKDWLH